MDVLKPIKDRRSIRRFKSDPIANEKIRVLLESARLAPSGTNSQPWRFIVIKNKETLKDLQKASHNQRHVGTAPLVIACCADINAFYEFPERVDELIESGALPEKSRSVFVPSLKKSLNSTSKSNMLIAAAGNTAIAITHMMIQATEIGLGSCWVRWFDDNKVKEILNVPQNVEVMALLPVGIPDENPSPRPRMPIDDLTFYEQYGEKVDSGQ